MRKAVSFSGVQVRSASVRIRGLPGIACPGVPLVAVVIAIFCAAPVHALEPYDVSAYAEYSPETGTISLTPFLASPNPGVDWPSVDAGKIRLVGCTIEGGCVEIPLAARVATDVFGKDFLEFSAAEPEALSEATSLTLMIGEGAYRKAANGAANVPVNIPVIMPGERVEDLLEGAEYDHLVNELSLFFSDAVDPSSVDWGRIYLYGTPFVSHSGFLLGSELVTIPMPEPNRIIRVGEDGREVVFAPDSEGRNALLSMWHPLLLTSVGAYRGDEGTVGQIGLFKEIAVPEEAYEATRAGLASAEYLVEGNRLYLRFNEEVDFFSIRVLSGK